MTMLLRSILHFASLAAATAVSASPIANHPFQRVVQCETDYSEINFCDKAHLAAINKAVLTRRADFNEHYIFLTVPVAGNRAVKGSAVVIDTKTGMVYPLPFDFYGGYVDRKGFPVSSPALQVKYDLQSPKICIHGSTYAYRDVYENQVSCFVFNGAGFDKQ